MASNTGKFWRFLEATQTRRLADSLADSKSLIEALRELLPKSEVVGMLGLEILSITVAALKPSARGCHEHWRVWIKPWASRLTSEKLKAMIIRRRIYGANWEPLGAL